MKKLFALLLALMMLTSLAAVTAAEAPVPKYVFLFIGDGQGIPQITATQYYTGTVENPDAPMPIPAQLSFTQFESLGMVTTYDATSFCPDSSSTASSIASGRKTLSGVLNYDVTLTEEFKLITEYIKQGGNGMKVGVVTSVSLDHATPSAFYAKAKSRNEYYNIACQGVTGQTLDFLGGGGFLEPDGPEGKDENVYALAEKNGFTVADTIEEIQALDGGVTRALASVPDLDDSAAMQYEIDRLRKVEAGEQSLPLSDIVRAAIAVLDNDKGFFLMTEGGKVDWASHANDAMTGILETLALSEAIQVALDFAAEHPDDTLILVTGDHETGGLTIGFAMTKYDTHFGYLSGQTISFVDFDRVIGKLRAEGGTFDDTLKEIERFYGLTTTPDQPLTLNDDELARIRSAYTLSMVPKDQRPIGDAEKLAYGGYEPLSMAVCHTLNNKAGIAYTSFSHTGLQVPVYAHGPAAHRFSGAYDNTGIFDRLMEVLELKASAA